MSAGTRVTMRRVLKTAGTILLGSLAVAAQAAPGTQTDACAKPVNGKGTSGFYCIGTDVISEESYCLRQSGSYPAHIRGMKSASALAMIDAKGQVGSAKVAKFETPKEDNPCYDNAPLTLMDKGDRIAIVPNDRGGLTFSILQKNATPPFSIVNFSVDILPGPAVNGLVFYWVGSKRGVDYFIYLADDMSGDMNVSDESSVPKIEKFIRLEAFKQDAPTKCSAHRPDMGATDHNVPQVHPWSKGQDSCDIVSKMVQHGTGGGGHDLP